MPMPHVIAHRLAPGCRVVRAAATSTAAQRAERRSGTVEQIRIIADRNTRPVADTKHDRNKATVPDRYTTG
jgi:penicillin V acylase-like amidase (Ntn superfamily)